MRRRNDDPDDERAVRLVLSGEREMLVPLLRRHYASTLRLCRRILGSESEAQDVVQEATLQAFLNLGRLREPRHFGAWLHSIAANLARSALRRRRPLSLDLLGEEAWPGAPLVDASPTPEEVRVARELHDTILEALSQLSSVNRKAVIGYYLEGHSYAELADLLNVPVSTVKGRLHKGRRQLEPTLTPVAREIFGTEWKEDKDGWATDSRGYGGRGDQDRRRCKLEGIFGDREVLERALRPLQA
jgi:RNA polymerase sigma factor (sigma-70 family)